MLTPADLFEVRKIVSAAKLLDSGDFDAEIARMEEAAQKTVEAASAEATKIRQQADQYLDTVQTKTDALMERVEQGKAELAADRDKFETDKAAAETQSEENYNRVREAQKELDASKAELEAKADEIEPRLAEIARREANLETAQARTDALAAELTEKLSRLRELSA